MGDRNVNIIEKLHESGLMYLALVSLISSDTLHGVDDCERSLRELKRYDEALKDANIDEEEKKKYQKYIDNSFDIVNRDMKKFIEEMI